MALTHTWNIRKVEYETNNNSVKCLHWTLDSADGNDKASSYGCAHLTELAVLTRNAVTQPTMLALLFRRLASSKEKLEERNKSYIKGLKESVSIPSKEIRGPKVGVLDDIKNNFLKAHELSIKDIYEKQTEKTFCS